jgi:nucleoside-diphosphate-sugar epimerase
MERALITGAAGFIGSHLAAELLHRGWAVTGLDARSPASDPVAAENLAELTGDPRFQFVAGDVTGGDLAIGLSRSASPSPAPCSSSRATSSASASVPSRP